MDYKEGIGKINITPSKMPIKQRIQQIDLYSKEGIKCLNENKKVSQLLRSECATLEH
jgi:hypothetical protein